METTFVHWSHAGALQGLLEEVHGAAEAISRCKHGYCPQIQNLGSQ